MAKIQGEESLGAAQMIRAFEMLSDKIFDTREAKEKNDKDAYKDRKVRIAREGKKIILPNDPRAMTEDEAILVLKQTKEEKNKLVNISEEFECYPLEGAWALSKVIERMFGYVITGDTVQTFFGPKAASSLVNLEVKSGVFEQVLWGKFKIPGSQAEISTGGRVDRGAAKFVISGMASMKDKELIDEIAFEIRTFLKTNSLYKGQAIKIQTMEDEERDNRYIVDFYNAPSFIDLSQVNENELVFSADVQSLIQTNLFTPIEKTAECRAAKIPLKRSVLLEGPYGTGKTLTAYVTAKKAVTHGWTFIYMDRAQALKDVLIFARKYAPVAIFCEDVEQVTSGGRTTATNDVLNNIDGLDSKGHEVICIFTTNHIEKIEEAMLRAGRLDAIITVNPPDAKAAERLVRTYAQDLIAKGEDLTSATAELAGQIPAFIREVVERAKLFAIGHLKAGETLTLTANDVRLAAVGMKRHFALVNRPKPKGLSEGDKLALALVNILGQTEDWSMGLYTDEETAMQHRRETDSLNGSGNGHVRQ